MKLASHNSMTYLTPKKWWLKPFKWMAKCQSKNIKEQYKAGVRYFDLRIAFDKHRNIEFRHGLIAYKGDVSQTLNYLNSLPEKVVVRLLLERAKDDLDKTAFKLHCATYVEKYSNIQFTGGRYKIGWEVIYPFNDVEIEERYASITTKNKVDDLWPWLYSKLHNKKNLKKGTDKPYLMLDFI